MSFQKIHQTALLLSLYKRIKFSLVRLVGKKQALVSQAIEQKDADQLSKLRASIIRRES